MATPESDAVEATVEAAVERILAVPPDPPLAPTDGRELGRSREDRPLSGVRVEGRGRRVSLVGGCHADEPIGPRFLGHLVAALRAGVDLAPLPADLDWWIVPHANPDGAARNATWQFPQGANDPHEFDPCAVLAGAVRELPGDDVEFGFPRWSGDAGARPENRAIARWWRSAGGPFAMHASLHGMLVAGGPWFLIDRAWVDRTAGLRDLLLERVAALGHRPHDVERHGEKGFDRIERGFATRPDSVSMRAHFLALGDENIAERFRPSSMEFVRSLGGDPLTLVSEVPLLVARDVGEEVGPPDPAAVAWRERIDDARARLVMDPTAADAVRDELGEAGLAPFPVADALRLVGTLVLGGILTAVGPR